MGYKGRLLSVIVVIIFNVIRYFYYHQYMQMPFRINFFYLTAIFMVVAWWGGKQYDLVQYYAVKDPLTGFYNRRNVNKIFDKLISLSKKKREKLGVIVIDLNDFKRINDTYGHEIGDRVLQFVSSTLQDVTTKKDYLVRWGGDEFIVFVPSITEQSKIHFIHSFKAKLQLHANVSLPAIRASVGVAVYPNHGENMEDLIKVADIKMYQNKSR